MCLIGESGQELEAKITGLSQYYQAAQTRIPQSAELVSPVVAAHSFKRRLGPWKLSQDSWRRWREKDHQRWWWKEADSETPQLY